MPLLDRLCAWIKPIEIKSNNQQLTISDLIVYKSADDGGGASIKGKLFARDYNGELTELNKSYYLADEYVYLVFGDSETYNTRTKTLEDGTFIFYGLRPGNYKLYAFSKDLTQQSEYKAVFKEARITGSNQEFIVTDIIVNR